MDFNMKYYYIDEVKYHEFVFNQKNYFTRSYSDTDEMLIEEIGVRIDSIDDNDRLKFEIVDEKKFVLARLKYNL